ncbi:hypothetical protein MD588_20875 [Photobacterium sp. SDRW27]|uniref:hypothetical protein n=1 Tax=Photobacterium obscurum TaxID=2829490 RepID=UPI0022449567|nr:hypothetical protein [Photobacterium obscurum]MCW8331250.1 hypothetical protein [Photobacterium obscurum]
MSALRKAYKPRIPMPSHQCSLEDRASIPNECGVYAISKGFECLLVGSSTNVGKALQSIHKIGDVQVTLGCTAQFWRCRPDELQAKMFYFIYAMDPLYNLHLPDNFVDTMLDYIRPDSKLVIEDIERFAQHFSQNRAYRARPEVIDNRKAEITRMAYLAAFNELTGEELDIVQDALNQVRMDKGI